MEQLQQEDGYDRRKCHKAADKRRRCRVALMLLGSWMINDTQAQCNIFTKNNNKCGV
ncbi:hypothetical protein GCM10022269_16100 [Sphingorhabdus rigui]